MGFLIFAYRKLTLRRKINQDQYRQMQLSQEQQQIQSEISIMQQGIAAKQDMTKQILSNISDGAYSGQQMWMLGQNNAATNAKLQYMETARKYEAANPGKDAKDDPDVKKAWENFQRVQNGVNSAQMTSMWQANVFQNQMMATNQIVNSIFNAKDEGTMKALKSRDTRISQEMASLESQLKLENAEYDSVEKAESEEAKKSAPKFGLG